MLSHLQELFAELNLGPMRSEVPSLAVSLALEAKASHRELTSRLLADLCGTVLSHSDMESSFDKLLRDLPDLVLDTPGAPKVSLVAVNLHIRFAFVYLNVSKICQPKHGIKEVKS